jgi:lipopolysaccharide transport system ATP-binding protein
MGSSVITGIKHVTGTREQGLMKNKGEDQSPVSSHGSQVPNPESPVAGSESLITSSQSPVPGSEIAISVRNLSKSFRMYNTPSERVKELLHPFKKKYHKDFWALRDINIEVLKGTTFGIIGQNGSGKSTLLQVICGILQPTIGTARINGRISALLELGAGFNNEFTGRENVFMNGAVKGISREEMERRFERITDFAEIGHFIDQPVKTYSSGMYIRLAFSVAINIDPDILIVDEALAVGDVRFQARCFDRIEEMRNKGVTILFVTHALQTFQTLCSRGVLLDNGTIFAEGEPKDISQIYHKLQRDREHAYQERLKSRTKSVKKDSGEAPPENKKNIASPKSDTGQEEFRFGLRTAKITDFKVYNHEDVETYSLESGKKFKVWMKIEFFGDVENPAVGVMIRNPQGQNLLGIHSYHGHRINFGEKKSGDMLSVTLESLMSLNPGRYTLNIGLADHRTDFDYDSIDIRNNVAGISVFGQEFTYGLINNPANITVQE